MGKAKTNILDSTSSILTTFLRDEAIGGRLILIAAVLAVIVVNSSFVNAYESFWQRNLTLGVGGINISQDLLHWLNEGLMTLFFFVVGLEVRREITYGELKDKRIAVLPVAAALGGMVVPALIYMFINKGSAGFNGWGIPIATDIAIAVGVLSLVGKRIPRTLRVFLLTLAIVDDIGAIIVIALFYSSSINLTTLGMFLLLIPSGLIIRKLKTTQIFAFLLYGIILWYVAYGAGITPSIVGVILAMLVSERRRSNKISVAETLEKITLPLTTFIIVPLFAFANAGIILGTSVFGTSVAALVGWGVFLGLFLGKVAGISLVTWLMVRSGISKLPKNIQWQHIVGVGFLAGIGFTISIYVTGLAFESYLELADAAKMSIFIASLVSGIVGFMTLKRIKST